MIVGYSFGAWDLLHTGHLNQLEQAKLICDFLIVGVFTDDVVEGFKRKPIIPFEQRLKLVAASASQSFHSSNA
jgi:glycerol-3-phosphate cytidylyltransferase